MNILWDFRLFSHGYGARGVGAYTLAMVKAIREAGCGARIMVWGQKDRLPVEVRGWPVQWINYMPGGWKRDLLTIPALIIKHHIDIFHYWIALGPIFRMGMGLFHPCKTCATVFDAGVEYWDEVSSCAVVRKTMYWKIQKQLFPMADSIACDSFATRWDLERLFRGIGRKIKVLYPPINYGPLSGKTREKRFVVLDGGENKNTKTVLIAFQQFRENHPEYALAILGQRSIGHCNEEGVSFESMDRYQELLAGSCGLLFCSLHEGLGLPALEAMSFACPMVLSDIPALRETCDEAGCFVDPRDIGSIVAGMEECVLNNREWVKRSAQGALRYKNMSENAGKEWLEIYNRLV